MNRKNTAFIWDLDGTLLDSYGEIASSTRLACADYGIMLEEQWILDFTIRQSGKALLEKISAEHGISFQELHQTYLGYHHAKADEVTAAPHAEQILRELTEQGCRCFVFTHRGASTVPILKRLQLYPYFTEIVTMEEGFARKPAPDANLYLIEKYHLDKEQTFFVGDRQMDMECAQRTGIKKILYRPEYSRIVPSGTEDYIISDFMQIHECMKSEKSKDR